MAPRSSPTVWRRWLALELRRLRLDARLSQKDVGKAGGWSAVRTSYLENPGQQIANDDDLDTLLPLYGVPVDDQPQYYEAAKLAREKGWWESFEDRDAPDYLKQFVGLEQGATRIRAVEPFLIPGLLQTREYIVEVLRGDLGVFVPAQMKRIADLRLRRQDILVGPEATSLDVVIDESVLRRIVRDEGLMASQLDHLIAMTKLPTVTIRVFPFKRGINNGMTTGCRIIDLGLGLDAVIFLEHWNGGNWLEEREEVEAQIASFDHVAADALPPDESIALLRDVVAGYDHT